MTHNAQKLSPQALANYCDNFLAADEFSDYCPNGLQIDADKPIAKLVTGVTASLALIEAAQHAQADALLVHHGYFWKGESEALVGMKGARIRLLMQQGISLLAYHLPLDAHTELGNNAVLANMLGLTMTEPLFPKQSRPVGNIAVFAGDQACVPADVFASQIEQALAQNPLHIPPSAKCASQPISRIGLCTGAAQDFIDQAALMGCDAYISGEISERTTHSARELGIHYFACGHHATEKGGVQKLGEHIAKQFGITTEFIDIDNPA